MAGLTDFIGELRRRNVVRIVAAYAVASWLIIQIASIVLPAFHLPDWIMQALLVLVVIGFPLAIAMAWTFELTPEGIRRDEEVDRTASAARHTGRKLDFIIIAVLSVAVAFFALDKLVWDTEETRQTGTATGSNRRSVAVLPFSNMSGDDSNNPFTVGIHDDLLTHLSKIASIKTISRTSMQQYRDTTKSIPEIAAELGVATILEGGVQRAGDRVRINVQLIDAKTDAHLWADTYDRQLTTADIFAIQTEIATEIASALQATLTSDERRYISTIPTENLEAYEAFQLGRQLLETGTTKSVAEAVALLEQATSLDPDFAIAWAKLADAYRLLRLLTSKNVDQLNQKALAAAERAIRLDDQSSDAHSAIAAILEWRSDFQGAIEATERALQLDPNNANTRFRYASVLHSTGRVEHSLLEFEKAAQLDPLSPLINDAYAWTLSQVGRFEESLARYKKVDEIDPKYPGTAASIGTIYGLAFGRLDLTNLWYRKALALDPGNPWLSALLALVFIELGDDETAMYWINRSLRQAPEHDWALGAMMMLQSYRGESELVRQFADRVLSIDPRWRLGTALAHGRVPDFRNGRYAEILARYEASFPELFGETPNVNATTFRAAIDVAGMLPLIGEDDRSRGLFAACREQIAQTIRTGFHGFWVSDVQILALEGKTGGALAALRQAIDEGWRTDWRFFFYVDPNLDSIRDEPEFQAMLEEVKADMAAQLQRARQMDDNGELAPIPPEDT
jgi:TolB-like protein/Flp pilus assembly protein TadD